MEETLCRGSMPSLLEEWRLLCQEGMEGWGVDKGSKQEARASGPESGACEHCQDLNFSEINREPLRIF